LDGSDQEIIAQVLAGDRDQFRALVERHGRALLGYLRRKLSRPEEAHELFQEAFVRAFERLGTLRDRDRFRGWLIAIARNALQRRLRRPTPVSLEAEGRAGPEAEPGAALERRELGDSIRREVAALPPRQREVFELRIYQELSHAEIAGLLGITEESARANFYQAARRLRERLAESES